MSGLFKFYFSLLIAKLAYGFLKLTRISSGTSVIGMIVLKIYPEFLSYCNRFIKTKINVTGTNGKTTTSGLLTSFLKTGGYSVINNTMGANMLTGVVNALSVNLNPFGKTDFSVIESDEAYLSKIYDTFDADFLVVTNLFRDQLDRYGELAMTKKLIQEAIDKKPEIKLILNADDPLVASFEAKNRVFFGVENVCYADGASEKSVSVEETFNCPCGKPLKYEKKFFAQQGHYYCDCGFNRPDVKYKADITIYKDHSVIKINGEEYKVPLVGLFNAYNALASISASKEAGAVNIKEPLENFKVTFGRSEVKFLKGHRTLIQLIKNPIGASEVLKTVDLNSKILIAINDNYADGRDVSWLWDASFELLADANEEIIVSGIRAEDMALRLKYAGNKNVKVIKDLKKAVEYAGNTAKDNITILPTYTALLKINRIIK